MKVATRIESYNSTAGFDPPLSLGDSLIHYVERLRGFIHHFKQDGHAVVVASGYWNPCHVGHIRYLEAACKLGVLVAVVNNDHQVSLKGSVPFMNEADRLEIVSAIKFVDYACLSIDTDRSISRTLEMLHPDILANGGDVQSEDDCREAEVCKKLGIQMVFGVGGTEKICSSSKLISAIHSRN